MQISEILLYFQISVNLYLGTYIFDLDTNTYSLFTVVIWKFMVNMIKLSLLHISNIFKKFTQCNLYTETTL